MCLVTYHQKPMVASKDIKVYKHVSNISSGSAKSPYQGTWFDLNKEFVAQPSETYLSPYIDGKRWEINGGAIHACLWPDFERGRCLEAYIPEGTEYWYGIDKSTVCAKKLFVTDKEVKPEDCAGMDEEIASAVYSESPKNNEGVAIGSFLVFNDFVGPAVAASCSKKDIQGIVVGFNGNEPVVADIQNLMESISIDNDWDSKLDKYIPDTGEAMKDMDGYKHTKSWKETCENNPKRYEAYNAVAKLSENHYIPALGEMELFWKNLIYIAAACSLANVACPFTMGRWYSTSTEHSQLSSWYSFLSSDGACRDWNSKDGYGRVVPFVASANLRKKSKLTWIQRLCNSLRKSPK